MIKISNLNKLRISELLQFIMDVLGICQKYDPEKLLIAPKVEALKADNKVLDAAFKVSPGSSISEQIETLDERRDDCLIGIRTCAVGFSHHYDSEMAQAGLYVLDSFRTYGKNIARLNYPSETSTVSSLTSDWESNAKYNTALIKLNLLVWARELRSINTEFNDVYLSRVTEKAGEPSVVATEYKHTVMGSYQGLVTRINARAEVDEDGQYLLLINELNELIDKYNTIVKNRGGKDKPDPSPEK